MKQFLFLFIIFILFVGSFLRFYKLDWGGGIYSHPDEYHIAASVSQLSFPHQMHPHFFSYGTVTIYLIYFTQELLKIFSSSLNSCPELCRRIGFLVPDPFILGRFYSALFSSLTIIIVYKICRSFMERRFSYLAALLVILTPGLIQQAHFATPESALTFFLFGSLLFIIKFLKQSRILFLVLASVFLGLALGVKVSSVVFLLPILAGTIVKFFRKPFHLILFIIASFAITIATFAVVAPYVFLDFPAFRSNLEYEGGLAVGKIPVFYTRQFIDTTPVLFQIEKILPYALGPILLIFSVLGFIFIVLSIIKKPKAEPIIVGVAFLSLFIPNAFLFAKWTRFIAPTFPFFAIFAAFFLDRLYARNRSISNLLTIALLVTTLLWTAAFFSIYLHPDVRITASNWIERNFPENSTILIESGNMIDIPLKGNFKRVGFDFYNLEEDTETRSKIATGLEETDYFLVQSRRVFMNHQRLPKLFPKTANLYDKLFRGELGFKQVKEFHSYPSLRYLGISVEFPDEKAEETWSVFDHPVIRVFKKVESHSKADYEKFFEN